MAYAQIVSFKISFIPKTILWYEGVAANLEENYSCNYIPKNLLANTFQNIACICALV